MGINHCIALRGVGRSGYLVCFFCVSFTSFFVVVFFPFFLNSLSPETCRGDDDDVLFLFFLQLLPSFFLPSSFLLLFYSVYELNLPKREWDGVRRGGGRAGV